jgi:protein SCO1/2
MSGNPVGNLIARGVAVVILSLAALAPVACFTASASEKETKPVIPPIRPPAGGPFSLIDHSGRRMTEADFSGRYLLVYFGYTHCPDVCPTGVQAMSDAVDYLGADGEKVQPIFITVDPERDRGAALADYVGAFHPRLVGLTGTPEEIESVAKAYRVRYRKLYYPWSGDEKDEDGKEIPEYAVHHTAFTYFMAPDGRGLAAFPHGAWPENMAKDIQRMIGNRAKSEGRP